MKLLAVNKTSKTSVEFASLVKLETGLQWIENLVHILTPRLLVAGFVLSMVDLLTHGNLLQNSFMLYVWAVIQALAVDATLPSMWRLAFTRFDEKRYVSGGILFAIGLGLGVVVFAALAIQFLQQSTNVTLDQAMSKLYLSPELLTYIRSGSVVFLAAVLSVLNRTKVTPSYKTENQGESKLVNKIENQGENSEQTHKATGLQGEQTTGELLPTGSKQFRLLSSTGEDASKQQLIRNLLQANPSATVTEIVALTGVSKGYASTQRTRFLEETLAQGNN